MAIDIHGARIYNYKGKLLTDFTAEEWKNTYNLITKNNRGNTEIMNHMNFLNEAFQLLKKHEEIKKEVPVEPELKSTQVTPKDPFYKRWYHIITPKSWRKKHKPLFSLGDIYSNDIHPIKIRGGYKKRRTMKRRKSLKRKTMKRRKSLKRSNSLKRKTIKKRKNRIK
tara:strand:+ start:1463 stop:1963 length:501 start_codon:yes stop_codon:yes gene_type:complete